MKKNLFLLLAIPLFLFSCKKEHSSHTASPGKKYAVKFNVANFAQQQGVFSVEHPGKLSVNDLVDAKDYLDVLYYVVYDIDGRYSVSTITQDSTQRDMGSIVDSLPNGTYPVRIFAGKKGLTPLSSYDYLPFATYGYQGIGHYNWLDTFWAGFSLTVSNGSITKNVTLNRVVSKLQLLILDNIPANANSISMRIYPESPDRFVQGGSDIDSPPDTTYAFVIIPASAKGQPNFTLDKILSGTEILSTIIITCKDVNNHVIASVTTNNVEVDENKKTILSGNLFGGPGPGNSQTFQVKIDTAWSSTTSTIHF